PSESRLGAETPREGRAGRECRGRKKGAWRGMGKWGKRRKGEIFSPLLSVSLFPVLFTLFSSLATPRSSRCCTPGSVILLQCSAQGLAQTSGSSRACLTVFLPHRPE